MRFIYLTLIILLASCTEAYAYVGPGLGLGAIGAFIGMVVAIFLAIVGVFWFPIKRMLIKFNIIKPKEKKEDNTK
jgi:O-antigen/teichoic acid export membrane protein